MLALALTLVAVSQPPPPTVSLVGVGGLGVGWESSLNSVPLFREADFKDDVLALPLFFGVRLGYENRIFVEYRRGLSLKTLKGPDDPAGRRRPAELTLQLTTSEWLLGVNPLWNRRTEGLFILAGGGSGGLSSSRRPDDGWNTVHGTWGLMATIQGGAYPGGIAGGFGVALEVRHARLSPRVSDLPSRFHHSVILSLQVQGGFGFSIGLSPGSETETAPTSRASTQPAADPPET